MSNLKIQILDVLYRERLIAEIQCDNYVIAEINDDNGIAEIEVFSYDEKQIAIPVDEFINIINEAKTKLVNF
jgi:hypothetical protein